MKEPVAFRTSLDFAEEFFIRCMDKEAVTITERMAILREMQKELKVISLNEQDLKNVLRNKKALVIKKGNKNGRRV